jgi:hypothetical protein
MRTRWLRRRELLALGAVLLLVGEACVLGADEPNKYVGAEKCKNCHAAAAKGDPYTIWTKTKHAQAYAVLATPEAKKVSAEKKIDYPQKSEACLVCHETAYGVPAAEKHKKFDETQGVQCESCHGPGGKHVAARLAADVVGAENSVQPIGKGEIMHDVMQDTCKKCHNEKSPNYKPFCFRKMAKAIAHLDPRRNHPADFFDKLPCDCPECKK